MRAAVATLLSISHSHTPRTVLRLWVGQNSNKQKTIKSDSLSPLVLSIIFMLLCEKPPPNSQTFETAPNQKITRNCSKNDEQLPIVMAAPLTLCGPWRSNGRLLIIIISSCAACPPPPQSSNPPPPRTSISTSHPPDRGIPSRSSAYLLECTTRL